MKKSLIFGILIFLVFSVSLVLAVKPDTPKAFKIPAHAKEIAPGVFSLGKAFDVSSGRFVEGYAFVHYKGKKFPRPGKPGTECGNGICEPGENAKKCPADCAEGGENNTSDGTESCYKFLAKGAKWKTLEDYIVNPSNNEGLSSGFVTGNLASDIQKWEDAAGVNIIGSGSSTSQQLEADETSPDNKNEVYFGSIDSPGAIAVTIVWGIFAGPPKARELVEWDQIYDEVDYNWSDSGQAGEMDFENIATHELGHTMGLDDLYMPSCSEATMYGYAWEGETIKRSLANGDKIGVQKLYK